MRPYYLTNQQYNDLNSIPDIVFNGLTIIQTLESEGQIKFVTLNSEIGTNSVAPVAAKRRRTVQRIISIPSLAHFKITDTADSLANSLVIPIAISEFIKQLLGILPSDFPIVLRPAQDFSNIKTVPKVVADGDTIQVDADLLAPAAAGKDVLIELLKGSDRTLFTGETGFETPDANNEISTTRTVTAGTAETKAILTLKQTVISSGELGASEDEIHTEEHEITIT